MLIENLQKKKKHKCAPRGAITAVYLNSVLFHSVCYGIRNAVTANGSLDDVQYAQHGVYFLTAQAKE